MTRLFLAFCATLLLAPPATGAPPIPSEVLSPSVYLADAAAPDVALWTRNAHDRAAPGSTTKIMTCILTLEYCAPEALIPVPAEALGLSGTRMGLKRGERYTARELLYGLMLVSGNDAAVALAVYISGSVEEFAAQMNEKAAALGMADTHFCNPHGLFHEEHYSTSRDMAVLTAYALENPVFCEIVGTAACELPATRMHSSASHLKNTNKLISAAADSPLHYAHAIGVKTGSTPRGGMALVSAARRDGLTLICVMMGLTGADDDASYRSNRRFSDSIALFEYEFDRRAAATTSAPSPSPPPLESEADITAEPTPIDPVKQNDPAADSPPALPLLAVAAVVALCCILPYLRKSKRGL